MCEIFNDSGVIMKKVMLTKAKIANTNNSHTTTMPSTNVSNALISLSVQRTPTSENLKGSSSSPECQEVFKQRKAMKAAYEELFRALFKIPDKEVQQRVLDAINGMTARTPEICVECMKGVKIKRETAHSGTQTEMEFINGTDGDEVCRLGDPSDSLRWLDSPITENGKESSLTESNRKKRKRKNRLPRVMMQSHAQQHAKEQPPLNANKANKRGVSPTIKHKDNNSNSVTSYPVIENDEVSIVKRQRCDSLNVMLMDVDCDSNMSQFDAWLDCITLEEQQQQQQPTDNSLLLSKVYAIMEKEFYESENVDEIEGFLPIHQAIVNNDCDRLRRQIYVWTRLKKVDLSEVLTRNDEDCMEVALSTNSNTKMVEMLLNYGYNINAIFESSWNVFHLAIYNEVAVETVISLAQKADLSLLHAKNDDGHTPLFLALRENTFLYFEAILQVIDERLNLKSYKRDAANSEMDSLEKFTQFYALQCENIQSFYSTMNHQSVELRRKQTILNEADPKSGNTMLLYAIEQKLDHFIHLLLAHLASPMVKNYSGQNARSFYNEYGRSYKLNIRFDRYLESVVATLKSLQLEE